jgi:hypothetical protein
MCAEYTRKLSFGHAFTREQQTIRRSNYEQHRHPRAGSLTIRRPPVIVDPKPAQWLHAIKIATKLVPFASAFVQSLARRVTATQISVRCACGKGLRIEPNCKCVANRSLTRRDGSAIR